MVTCNPDICLIRMFFASQIQLHIPTDVPLICQFMASKGFVGDRLLTRQAKKKNRLGMVSIQSEHSILFSAQRYTVEAH